MVHIDFIGKSAQKSAEQLLATQEEELKILIGEIEKQVKVPTAAETKILSHADDDLHKVIREHPVLSKKEIDITDEMLDEQILTAQEKHKVVPTKVTATTPKVEAEEPTSTREGPGLGGKNEG